MSSLKFINSCVITIMLLIPFSSQCLDENKIVKNRIKNNLVSITEKDNNSNKIKKRVKLRPEKEVNNFYKINI